MQFLLTYTKRLDEGNRNSKEWGEKGTTTSAIATSSSTRSPAPFRSGLSLSPLAAEWPIETSLIGFHVLCQIKLQMDFSFPNHIPAYSVSPYFPQVLYPCFQFLQAAFFIAEFCWELLFHPSRPPAISLNFLLLGTVDSWAWETQPLKNNQLFWALFYPGLYSMGFILPSRSQEKKIVIDLAYVRCSFSGPVSRIFCHTENWQNDANSCISEQVVLEGMYKNGKFNLAY